MSINECAIMFSGQNLVDSATVLKTNWSANIVNLKTPEMFLFATTSLGRSHIELSLEGGYPIDVVATLKNNFLSSSKWRIRIYNDRFYDGNGDPVGPYVHDSGWIRCFPGLDLFGIAEWGGFDWGGFSQDSRFANYNRQSIYVLPDQVWGRFIRVDFDNGYGPSQMARLWVGEGFQPQHSAVYGSGVRFTDATTVKEAESGVKHRSVRTLKRRGMKVLLENEPKLELFYRLIGPIIGAKGGSQDFLTLLEPRDTASLVFQSIYGSISGEVVEVSHAVWNRLNMTFSIEESI